MTRSQVHVNSCGTGVSFMDLCEMRNKETERAEISEISREVVSSEPREGRDTCHTLQLFPEQQIERKGEKEIMEMTEQEEGELSELGSHSGLPVPERQSERKESMGVSVMEEESAVGRGPLCNCFYWLGALWR
ncbi:hypothetical protein M0R45_009207 [Rubus argutus]|uniref:Uncharacterized protein n=1 Tax=Rubus argutus TaxID=59490 RepID=A0AAW1Y5W4_RUBAR